MVLSWWRSSDPSIGSLRAISAGAPAAKSLISETVMKQVPAHFDTVHFGFHDATLAPILTIESGEDILIRTVSADPSHEVPAEWLPEQIHDIHSRAQRGT